MKSAVPYALLVVIMAVAITVLPRIAKRFTIEPKVTSDRVVCDAVSTYRTNMLQWRVDALEKRVKALEGKK